MFIVLSGLLAIAVALFILGLTIKALPFGNGNNRNRTNSFASVLEPALVSPQSVTLMGAPMGIAMDRPAVKRLRNRSPRRSEERNKRLALAQMRATRMSRGQNARYGA